MPAYLMRGLWHKMATYHWLQDVEPASVVLQSLSTSFKKALMAGMDTGRMVPGME